MASAGVLKPGFATRRRHFIFTDDHALTLSRLGTRRPRMPDADPGNRRS